MFPFTYLINIYFSIWGFDGISSVSNVHFHRNKFESSKVKFLNCISIILTHGSAVTPQIYNLQSSWNFIYNQVNQQIHYAFIIPSSIPLRGQYIKIKKIMACPFCTCQVLTEQSPSQKCVIFDWWCRREHKMWTTKH